MPFYGFLSSIFRFKFDLNIFYTRRANFFTRIMVYTLKSKYFYWYLSCIRIVLYELLLLLVIFFIRVFERHILKTFLKAWFSLKNTRSSSGYMYYLNFKTYRSSLLRISSILVVTSIMSISVSRLTD